MKIYLTKDNVSKLLEAILRQAKEDYEKLIRYADRNDHIEPSKLREIEILEKYFHDVLGDSADCAIRHMKAEALKGKKPRSRQVNNAKWN